MLTNLVNIGKFLLRGEGRGGSREGEIAFAFLSGFEEIFRGRKVFMSIEGEGVDRICDNLTPILQWHTFR
jgi:hypothetical protein